MAIISDTTKIDRAFKFVSGKGYTSSQKGVDNEDAPSGFILGASSIFSQDGGIPNIAPGVSTSILTYFDDGTVLGRYKMTYDISSPLNLAWYASSDGSSLTQMRLTRQGNWVPPTFGNYTIRIFLTKTSSTTAAYLQEIFFSDATSPLFDYKSGILTFESDPLAAYASIPGGPPDGIQISGYRYTGTLLSQIFDGNGNYTGGLSDLVISGSGTALAKFINPSKSFTISSPNAIDTTWKQEISVLSTAPEWRGVFTLPNGQVIAVGGDSGNTQPYIAYSYGSDDAYGSWLISNIANAANVKRLNAVWAPDNTTIYAVGQSSTTAFVKSTNGGLDWVNMADPGIGSINAIWGTSNTNLYIAAGSGAIRRSINGGTSFSAETTAPFVGTFFGLWGSGSTDIYAVGTSGTILHSAGLGTWTAQTSGTANTLRAVFGLSSTAIYTVGDSGTVLFSSGGGSWVAQTGLLGTFNATSIWGTSGGGITRLYIAGNLNSGAGPGAVYTSDGTGTWTLQTTFGSGVVYSMYGSTKNGVYIGNNLGIMNALHQNPIVVAQGNLTTDGYVNAGTALYAKELILHDRMFVLNKSNTIMEVAAADSGTSVKLARESSTSFAFNIGVTPTSFSANGILRLGNANGSNASQAEINNSSTTLNIIARTGQIIMTPGSASTMLVNLGTNNTATFLKVQGSGANSTSLFGNGAVTATGAVTGSQLISTSTISATTTITAGTNITATAGTITSSGNITSTGGNLVSSSGSVSANTTVSAGSSMSAGTTITAGQPISASTLFTSGGVRLGHEFSAEVTANVFGTHTTPGGANPVVATWGLGLNPCPGGGPYVDTTACFGTRVVGASTFNIVTYRTFLAGAGAAVSVAPSVPAGSGFRSEFGCSVEFRVNTSTTGFGLFGIVAIY